MKYADANAKVADYQRQITDIRKKIDETRAATEPQRVMDYEFKSPAGPVRLAQLFGVHEDLIVIHNMGTSCNACTMWADGYQGIHHHVIARTAFVVSSPDSPEIQQKFAASRSWTFSMVSHQGTTFAADMGYRSALGNWRPGISVFKRDGKNIVRVSDAGLQPHDDFCTVYHLFDLLPGGVGDWSPKLRYP